MHAVFSRGPCYAVGIEKRGLKKDRSRSWVNHGARPALDSRQRDRPALVCNEQSFGIQNESLAIEELDFFLGFCGSDPNVTF